MNFSENTRKQDRIDYIFGNDVVDLSDADSIFPDANFLNRVFTAGERNLIHAAADRSFVWILWAAKEAAYKAVSSITSIPFRWKSFEVLPSLSEVYYRGSLLSLEYHKEKDFIHAVCAGRIYCGRSLPDKSGLFSEALPFDPGIENESQAVRRMALEALCKRMHSGKEAFQEVAYGTGKAPAFLWNDKEMIRMSFSHHGKYAAFAYRLPQDISRLL